MDGALISVDVVIAKMVDCSAFGLPPLTVIGCRWGGSGITLRYKVRSFKSKTVPARRPSSPHSIPRKIAKRHSCEVHLPVPGSRQLNREVPSMVKGDHLYPLSLSRVRRPFRSSLKRPPELSVEKPIVKQPPLQELKSLRFEEGTWWLELGRGEICRPSEKQISKLEH